MPEPTATAAVTLAAAAGIAVPTLTILGIPLGLRADLLALGFAGAIAAISLLNSVPATGDTAKELIRTAFRRVGVVVGSALFAAALTPALAGFWSGIPESALNGLAFAMGAGAQYLLRKFIAGIGAKLDPTGADKTGSITSGEAPK